MRDMFGWGVNKGITIEKKVCFYKILGITKLGEEGGKPC